MHRTALSSAIKIAVEEIMRRIETLLSNHGVTIFVPLDHRD